MQDVGHRYRVGARFGGADHIADFAHPAACHDRHGDRFPDYLTVRRWKQSSHRSLLHEEPTSRTLAAVYADMATSAAEAIADLLARDAQRGPRRPYGLVATGGPTRIAGFMSLI